MALKYLGPVGLKPSERQLEFHAKLRGASIHSSEAFHRMYNPVRVFHTLLIKPLFFCVRESFVSFLKKETTVNECLRSPVCGPEQ